MTESPFLQALRLAEKSRQERVKKIADLLSELPDDFDWNELEGELQRLGLDSANRIAQPDMPSR